MMRLWRRNAFRNTGISELFSLMESIQRYGVFYIVSMSKHSKKQDFMRSGDDHSYGWANRQILHFSIQDFCLTSFFINIMVIEVDKTSIMKMLNAWLNKIPVTIYVFFSQIWSIVEHDHENPFHCNMLQYGAIYFDTNNVFFCVCD